MGEREGWGATALSLRHSDIESRKHSQIISFLMQREDKLIISSIFTILATAAAKEFYQLHKELLTP